MKHYGLHIGLLSGSLLSQGLGCRPAQQPARAPQSSEQQIELLVSEAKRLKRSGQGLKGEQYLLAAWDAGASVDEVAPLIISLCVAEGRLRSALFHVQRALRLRPRDARLVQLSATLYLALGQPDRATLAIEQLRRLEPAYPEAVFFLGEHFFSRGEHGRAQLYFRRFIQEWPNAQEAAWVRHLLSELEVQRESAPAVAQPPTQIDDGPTETIQEGG